MRFVEISSLLDPGYLRAETGYCTHEDGRGYVAVLTKMPGVTAEMLDWWFDWHPRDPLRYRIWFPRITSTSALNRRSAGAKAFYNTVHHPVEESASGATASALSFSIRSSSGSRKGRCRVRTAPHRLRLAGDDKRHARHTKMCHFARETGEGWSYEAGSGSVNGSSSTRGRSRINPS